MQFMFCDYKAKYFSSQLGLGIEPHYGVLQETGGWKHRATTTTKNQTGDIVIKVYGMPLNHQTTMTPEP